MSKRVLITGGAGYVGSKLVPLLLEKDYFIRILDWFLFDPDVFKHLDANPSLQGIRGDVRDPSVVAASMDSIDTVIHLASISNDPSCDIYPELTQQVNIEAVKLLVNQAKQKGVRRFIFASSTSVYGFKNEIATEESVPNPQSLYASSKVEAEKIVSASAASDFTAVSVRPATLCGFAPRFRLDLVVNILTYQALSTGMLTVFGGEQKRPFLTVGDMVEAYSLLLQMPDEKINGQVFNVTNENYRIIDIAKTISNIFQQKKLISVQSTLDHRSYYVSSEKISSQLGFRPTQSIADAVQEIRQAFEQGLVPDPEHPRYRNVPFMKTVSRFYF